MLAAASLRVCWPYITRLVEDNVTPGVDVNPAVDQQYTVFRDMQMFFAPDDLSVTARGVYKTVTDVRHRSEFPRG